MAKPQPKKSRRHSNKFMKGELAHPSKAKKPRGHRRRGCTAPPLPSEYKAFDVDTEMVRRYLCLNFNKSIEQLRAEFADERTPFNQASIISAMLRIFDTGDIYALNALYDRMIGPVLRRVHITGERPFAEWPLEKLIEEKKRLNKINSETVEMIEKERKLIALVNAGEIKPGDFTKSPEEVSGSAESADSCKNFVAK